MMVINFENSSEQIVLLTIFKPSLYIVARSSSGQLRKHKYMHKMVSTIQV